ncbi:hypothetical protein [Deinococcus sp. QL22]|uniref:hypothetical protein n=1 Tax=Deinococcus sp. QL22 TaxID=2939437 RepID=UPI002017B748|nr:hypothetical protein [Deinococcus sp. QL22]UQN10195.1 hypothetical protein M1R55_27860 [Deinococcus sp. QL22]
MGLFPRGLNEATALRQPIATEGHLLGFETLGVDGWSDAHTSVCYGIRPDFIDPGLTFNAEGYLSTLKEAIQGAAINNIPDPVNDPEASGGPVGNYPWFPVRLALPGEA